MVDKIISSGHAHAHSRVLIRSSTLPIKTLANFQSLVIEEAMSNRIQPNRNGLPSQFLDEGTEPAVLRGIPESARLIACLALDCSEHYLSKFGELKPEYLLVSLGKCYLAMICVRRLKNNLKGRTSR
jgi:hypothetical protein